MSQHQSGLMRAVVAVVAAALPAAACVIGGGASGGPVVHEHRSVERGSATTARVQIDMSAGELSVESGAKSFFAGDFDFNVPDLKPAVDYSVNGTMGVLKVSQGSASGNYENAWRLSLDETTPVDLHINLGAGDANLVLGRLNLEKVEVNLGAGDQVVDLRGMPAKSYSVTVKAGAGDTTIHLPSTVGITATTSGIIGDTNVSGLEKRDGRWINPRAGTAPVTVDLQVHHAIGDLRLLAE